MMVPTLRILDRELVEVTIILKLKLEIELFKLFSFKTTFQVTQILRGRNIIVQFFF